MRSGLSRVVLYVLIALLPALIAALVGWAPRSFVFELGRSCALVGFVLLALQFVLAARWKWVSKPFGFDVVIRYHKHMAVFALLLLIAHPLLLAAGGEGLDLLIGLDQPWQIWVGKAVLIALLLNVVVSAFQTRLRIRFERWRAVHDALAPLILAGAFAHSWFLGQDLQLLSLRTVWIVLTAAAFLAYVHHRFFRPWRLSKIPYRVVDVRREAEDVWTVELEPPSGRRRFDHLPGQFQFLTFFRGRGLPVEEHHWTISSSPRSDRVTSTIKAIGDFTATIGETRPGDAAAVHGPFGRFSYAIHPQERDLVFVAGGIGITPLMSMLRHMRDTGDSRSVRLLYANKTEGSIVFRDEIDAIAAGEHPRLEVAHVLSDPGADWDGLRGYVDREKLQRFCGEEIASKVFYVCGPPGLRDAVIGELKDMGVPDARIRTEIFSFID